VYLFYADRKKDLVKISTGKFVSLGKVESVLKVSQFVENICVYADSLQDHTVALVVPSRVNVSQSFTFVKFVSLSRFLINIFRFQLEKVAHKLGLSTSNYEEMCSHPLIHNAVLSDIQTQGKALNLHKYDIPKKITLCPEPWMPQSGLVTAAFKIKRNNVYKEYRDDINRMYASS
jgi:long-chain acyl-CoA synthetase